MNSRTDDETFIEFELEVARIYRELGAQVEHNKNIDGLQIDVFAVQNTPDGSVIKTGIECKNYSKSLGVNTVVKICERLGSLYLSGSIDKGVIVSKSGFTQDARTLCQSRRMECFSIEELYRRVADFTNYLQEIKKRFQERDIVKNRNYIALSAKTEFDEELGSVTQYINKWLSGSGQLLTMLGEYGAGKTTTSWYLANQMAKNYLDSETGRIPIIIELRDFGKNFNLRGYLTDFLINQYDTNLRTYSAFEKLNNEGKFLIIFDAFDEMTNLADRSLILRNLDEILQLAQHKAKILITCRTSFIRDRTDLERMQVGRQLDEMLHKHKTFNVIFLNDFSEEQVQEYLYNYYGEDWINFYKSLEKNNKLMLLADRPILLSMITSTISNNKSLSNMKISNLFEKYTNTWIERDDWRCKLSSDQRLEISELLAYELIIQARKKIHHKELESIIPKCIRKVNQELLDQYAQEVRTCAFLHNDLQGFYSFTHKSFAEFLTAKYIASQIEIGNINILTKNIPIDVVDLLIEIIQEAPEKYIDYIRDSLVTKPEDITAYDWNYIRAISISIIINIGNNLVDVDISNVQFPDKSRFVDIDFTLCNMSEIRGNKIDFEKSDFSGVNLNHAALSESNFRDAKLINTNFQGADLRGSNFWGADLSGSNFMGANLENSLLISEDIISKITNDDQDLLSPIIMKLQSSINSSDLITKLLEISSDNKQKQIKRVLGLLFNNWNKDDSVKNIALYPSQLIEFINESFKDLEKIYDQKIISQKKEMTRLQNSEFDDRNRLPTGIQWKLIKNCESKIKQIRIEKRQSRIKKQIHVNSLAILQEKLNDRLEIHKAIDTQLKKQHLYVENAVFTDCIGITKTQDEVLRGGKAIF